MRVLLMLRSLLRRTTVEQELDEEIRYHLDRQTEEFIARGLSAEEARRAAVRAMGGVDRRKEECRDARRLGFIDHAVQDLRYGARVSAKSPGFACAVIATLALGIGASTAMFSVVYGVTLRPLPYPEPDRLVTIGHTASSWSVGIANYLDWRSQNAVFEEIGITKLVQNFNITGDGTPERVLGGRSTASVFRVLRVNPLLGRVFTDEEGAVEDKVVLGYGLWTRRYGADPGILGKTIRLNGKPYTVLGVMPPEFQYPNPEFALWTPLALDPNEPRITFDYGCVARLKDGVTIAQAQAQMSEIHTRIATEHPFLQKIGIYVTPMLDRMVGSVRTTLYLLMGAVLCLLLIGCANLANLLVARSMARSQELVVRAALGANKRRLVLQSIMEVAPLAAVGGLGGILLAHWLLSLLVPFLPATLPRLEAIKIDLQVLGFAIAILFATVVLTGIWPALQVMRWNLNQALRDSGRATIGGRWSRLRGALVICQIAGVLVLMVASALLIRSFTALRNVDPGFRTGNILSVHFALSEQYATNPKFGQYLKRILDRVSVLPGVVSVGMVNRLPLSRQNQTGALTFEGSALEPGSIMLDWRTASPDYFRTMGIPLIEGRFFEESDAAGRPRVGIVDERLARLAWPNESAIGKRFRFHPKDEWVQVIGVVGHIRHDELGVDERPQVYWPYHQRSQPRMALAVRTSQDPNELAASVIAAIHEVDPEQPVYDVRTMDEVVDRSLSEDWLNMILLTLFASIALALAAVGVYGILSYSVGLRAREIGIRMALGSRRSEVIWMILRHGGVLALTGTCIGMAGSLLLGRVLSSLLFGITATDALSFLSAFLVLLIVALAASYIPARRAASLDPLSVLRTE